nr:protein NRT1/ PTR FAMILY 2.11-like [Tanacetum cinerariifolium]
MLVLTLTAAVTTLHPPHCVNAPCVGPTAWQMTFLLSSFVFLIIGASGIRPCNLAFGADQFNPNTESGQRGIASFFNWYYFTFTFAMMVSLTIIVYVQADVNWAIGLAIPTFLMFLSCAVFFIGTKIYVKVLPDGSPLTSIFQVLIATFKKRDLAVPEEPAVALFNHVSAKSINSKLPYSKQLRFLNKAAIITPNDKINPDGSSGSRWTLCSIQQIEEVKCVIKTIPIWLSCIIYNVSINQMGTYTVFQALQSDRRLKPSSFEVPAASYSVFQMLGLTIWIPIYDRLIVPCLRKITHKRQGISLLQRIGVGVGIAIFTMLVAAIIETKRRDLAHSKPTLGIQKGKGSFLFCGLAMSSYLSSFLITVVHRTTGGSGSKNEMKELAAAALHSAAEVLQSPNAFQKNMKITCEEVMKISNHFQESSQKLSHEEPGALYRRYQLKANQTPIRMDKSDAWRSVAQDLELSAAKEAVKAMRNLQAIIQCKAQICFGQSTKDNHLFLDSPNDQVVLARDAILETVDEVKNKVEQLGKDIAKISSGSDGDEEGETS